ncbi:hypothetical protein [Leptospira stimsonii]|uniref:Uncharacterized protein n=1 Tax=Leptospira stimsonii TaxID=2202203 RepID=A0ABY2N920_9LEPT|nr:hypothetical protein [Leptospira stimsonii]TGK10378.1 hypothetical protein EHO98_22980 [Leptospira stimsonii]TGM18738.1 hypothetical protein EHQ90_06620 [Leptospira stimsonii]
MTEAEFWQSRMTSRKNKVGATISKYWCEELGIDKSLVSIALVVGKIREADLMKIIKKHRAKAKGAKSRTMKSYHLRMAKKKNLLLEEYAKTGILIPDDKEKKK